MKENNVGNMIMLNNLPELVLDGRGILLAPFLRDLLTQERDEVNVALGIL